MLALDDVSTRLLSSVFEFRFPVTKGTQEYNASEVKAFSK